MPAASLETTLELWSTTLRQAKPRMRPLFAAPSVAASANAFLDGLLGAERRKTGWMRAEAAGDPGPWRQQAILGRSHWNADALRDVVRDHVIETLGAPEAVLVIDETGFLKQGHASCARLLRRGAAVHRLGGQDHQLPDRGVCRLCLGQGPRLHRPPALSAKSLDRRSGANDSRARASRHPLRDQATPGARHGRAGDRGGRAICLGDGRHRLRRGRDRAGAAAGRQGVCFWGPGAALLLVLGGRGRGIGGNRGGGGRPPGGGSGAPLWGGGGLRGRHSFWPWGAEAEVSGTAEEIATALVEEDWIRLSAGAGTQGPRLYDWAYLERASLKADALDPTLDQSLWTRGLLARRSLSDGSLAYFTTWCPAGTPIQELVAVEGRRWAIEDAFETAKTELGLAHNESRSWHGWHRHVSLVMLAFALLARVRQQANGPPPKTALIAKLAGSLVDAGNPARSDPTGATAH